MHKWRYGLPVKGPSASIMEANGNRAFDIFLRALSLLNFRQKLAKVIFTNKLKQTRMAPSFNDSSEWHAD